MGCDYKIFLQVLYNGFWITIIDFGTKTGCGGWPLCKAYLDLAKDEQLNIKGDYGTKFRIIKPMRMDDEFSWAEPVKNIEGMKVLHSIMLGTCYNYDENNNSKLSQLPLDKVYTSIKDESHAQQLKQLMKAEKDALTGQVQDTTHDDNDDDDDEEEEMSDECVEPPKKRRKLNKDATNKTKSKNKNNKSKKSDATEDVAESQTYRDKYESSFLYYSKEEFEKYNQVLKDIESKAAAEDPDPGRYHYTYTKIMNPVPMWLKMLFEKGAVPLTCGEIWMEDAQEEIDDTTQKIVQAQDELHRLYVNHLNQVMPPNVKALFPKEIVIVVAQYAHPTPTDVRFAIKDDEGRSDWTRNKN